MNRSPIYLVGAGPGDPELLTIKASKAIAQATVLLVDDLVNPEILLHASPQARITWVGKRGGCASTPQKFIEKLMIREALAGERVVRLKGGDPLIFGRAGEELSAIRKAGLQVEIINGISSAMAAAASAEVSLTHREMSHGIVFVTAHAANDSTDLHWPTLLKCGLTVAFYMGSRMAETIRDQAREHEIALSTPVLVVQNASGSQERKLLSTLGAFPESMLAKGLGSPAILLVGEAMSQARVLSSTHLSADQLTQKLYRQQR